MRKFFEKGVGLILVTFACAVAPERSCSCAKARAGYRKKYLV
jgi:hypothetical protein